MVLKSVPYPQVNQPLDDVFLEVTGYRLEGTEEPVEEKPEPSRRRGR